MLQPFEDRTSNTGIDEATAWYAVHTRSRAEKVASTQLSQKGIHTFLPLVTEHRRWSDRSKAISLPLFPNYVFVRIAIAGAERLQVLKTPGVQTIVGVGGAPQPIPDKEIEDVKRVFDQQVECSPYPFCKLGDKVRVRGGCLDGVEGILVSRNADETFVISIEMIQRSMTVRVSGFHLEPI